MGALLALCAAPASADEFWKYWGDGKAELDGYALTQPRYGAPRDGKAVLIFVTEDFSDSLRVKADPGRHPASDVYPVLKLNFVRKFQTGIYDYSVLTSTFARTEHDFAVTKTSFSSQEWCGHVYAQLLERGDRLTGEAHSYFDGEADRPLDLPSPPNGVQEDALPILLRGLRGEWLKPGETRTVPLLPSMVRARFAHKPQTWGEATFTRAEPRMMTSRRLPSMGQFRAFTVTMQEKDGDVVTWTIEDAYPHRILAWVSTSGEKGELLGSARLPYWQLNQPGGEANLKLLGLAQKQ